MRLIESVVHECLTIREQCEEGRWRYVVILLWHKTQSRHVANEENIGNSYLYSVLNYAELPLNLEPVTGQSHPPKEPEI